MSVNIPRRGKYVTHTCMQCGKSSLMKITSVKKSGFNQDGSQVFVLKAECHACDYLNGTFVPIWYNLQ